MITFQFLTGLTLAVLTGFCGYATDLSAGGAACPDRPAFASPSDLQASMRDPHRVELRWKYNATEPGGCFVEFIINPEDTFTTLDILSSDRTAYVHANLVPNTPFTYRVRAFFGKASETVMVRTRTPAPSDPQPRARLKDDFLGTSPDAEGPLEDEDPPAGSAVGAVRKPLRQAATFADAAPGRLTATLAAATTVDLRWEDRASDEDGYLIEVSADGKTFTACALLPPDSTSFRKTSLPPEAACSFRVRAFFYGAPSRPVTVRTGPESERRTTGGLEAVK